MRITDFSIYCYSLPYIRPVHWFDTVETSGLYVLLKIVADTGQTGIAEAPIRPTWSGVSQRSLIAALEDLLLPAVQAIDISKPEDVSRALGRFPENQLAKMLVDNACWSLRANIAEQPLWQLWGGRQQVELSWCVTRQEPRLMAEEAALMVERHGFRALKVKGGQGLTQDIAAVKQIRASCGDIVALHVDANCAYPREEAPGYVQALAELGVVIVEDPSFLAPDQQFSELVGVSPLPILVDTQCASVRDATNFLDRGATAISIKPGRIGLSEARRISALVSSRSASVAAGMYAESALGTLLSLQMAASVKGMSMPAENSFFLMLKEQVLLHPISIQDGMLELPASADISALIDWDRVKSQNLL